MSKPWHGRDDWKCPKCGSHDLTPFGDHSPCELSCMSCGHRTGIVWHSNPETAADDWGTWLHAAALAAEVREARRGAA